MSDEFLVPALIAVSWIATYWLHSTSLLGGVWLFLRWRKTAGPALREGLWKTALIGGILTTPLQMLMGRPGVLGDLTFVVNRDAPRSRDVKSNRSAVAERPLAPGELLAAEKRAAHAVPAEIWILSDFDASAVEADMPNQSTRMPIAPKSDAPAAATMLADSTQPQPAVASWMIRVVVGIAVTTFGLATAFGLLRWLGQSVIFRRRVARCRVIDGGPARELLDELCLVVPRSRHVRLLCSADDPEPAAFGVWQWTIVLPERAERDLPADELRSLLAHELAHLVRGDVAWLCVWRVVCSCLAFQPLNHLARREWQRAAELFCDTWAVNRTGSRLALARCLTEVAGWRLDVRACAASLAATGRKSGLADRIERLVGDDALADGWTAALLRRRLAVVACAIGGLLVACGPRVSLSAKEPVESVVEATEDRDAAKSFNAVVDPTGVPEIAEVVPEIVELPAGAIATSQASPVVTLPQSGFALPQSNITAALQAIDEQLYLVEQEMATVEALLKERGLGEEGERLVERLRKETAKLKAQRSAVAAARNGAAVKRPVVERRTVTEKVKENGG